MPTTYALILTRRQCINCEKNYNAIVIKMDDHSLDLCLPRSVLPALRELCPATSHGILPYQHIRAMLPAGRSLLGRILDQPRGDVRPDRSG